MGIIAIARVRNIREIAESRGWEQGYRLIDATTHEVSDISEAELIKKLSEKQITVANLTFLDCYGVIAVQAKYSSEEVGFPLIAIDVFGEHLENENGKDRRFILNCCPILDGQLLTLCNCFGADIRVVFGNQIADIKRAAKSLFILNKIGGEDLGAVMCTDITKYLRNKEVAEYITRSKLIGLTPMYLCDTLDSDGAYLIKASKDYSGTVEIPDFIEEIGTYAFANVPRIKRIKLGKGVKVIHTGAFWDVRLEQFELNEGLQEIRYAALRGAKIDGDLVIPKSIQSVNTSAFNMLECQDFVLQSAWMRGGCRPGGDMSWTEYLPQRMRNLVITKEVVGRILNFYMRSEPDSKIMREKAVYTPELNKIQQILEHWDIRTTKEDLDCCWVNMITIEMAEKVIKKMLEAYAIDVEGVKIV